jgi:hypothetical protein
MFINDSAQKGLRANCMSIARPHPWMSLFSVFLIHQTFTYLPTKEYEIDIVGNDRKTVIHHKVAARAQKHTTSAPTPTPPHLATT